jgi:hypothetical protein
MGVSAPPVTEVKHGRPGRNRDRPTPSARNSGNLLSRLRCSSLITQRDNFRNFSMSHACAEMSQLAAVQALLHRKATLNL